MTETRDDGPLSSDPTRPAARPPETDLDARVFVWGVWAVMLLAALAFVTTYAVNVPFWEEWELVPLLTGEKPLGVASLWEQHREHRIPLPKLIHVALAKATRCDFRSGTRFSVAALATLAMAMVLVSGRLRGRTSYADAFFPLAIMHLGQYENLLWGLQVMFSGSALTSGTFLLVVAGTRGQVSLRRAVALGVLLVCLSLFGPSAGALVPALSVWMVYAGAVSWRSREAHGKRDAVVLLVFTAAACALVGLYFVGYTGEPDIPRSPGPAATLRATLQFVSLSIGPAGGTGWPGATAWPLAAPAIVAACLATAGILIAGWYCKPQERVRAAGLLAFLCAMGSLAATVGWSRAGVGETGGFINRYVTLSLNLLCCVYLAWGIFGRPAAARFVQMGLFAMMCGLAIFNAREALAYGRAHRQELLAVQEDIRAGLSPEELSERHLQLLYPRDETVFLEGLEMMRKRRLGPYKYLARE